MISGSVGVREKGDNYLYRVKFKGEKHIILHNPGNEVANNLAKFTSNLICLSLTQFS